MRVAFDIGGTFTDVITLRDGDEISTVKVLSLLEQVGDDIDRCVREHAREKVERFVHATTICSNAVIERTIAPIGLLTTRGFRDTLELRAQKGPKIPSLAWRPPVPLVPRQHCLEVDERILADGTVEEPLDEESARAAIQVLLAAQVEAIAICLINSYLNPAHEQRLGELVKSLAPDVVVCLSSRVHPEVREYERTSTTAVNAALIPVVNRYLDRLEKRLIQHSPRLLIMQSNGGIMTAQAARTRPIFMVESGPAAGALAAARLATEMGLSMVLSFDMGGTTAKACLIRDGVPLERPGGEIGAAATVGGRSREDGYALRVPTIDLVEVGAGGGSIAWTDGGVLRVGPSSASADPGPVCYSRGGTQPTVTDANVVLGKINPAAIADGTVALDEAGARTAIGRLGDQLGLDVLDVAHGVTQVANAVMMRALRAVSTERGFDPRECTLVAFGGAGGLHAAALADSLGISEVIVPPFPGVFSALGLLLADYRIDYVASVVAPLDELSGRQLLDRFAQMEEAARREFAALGMPTDQLRFDRHVDVKYDYQIEDMSVSLTGGFQGHLGEWLAREFDAIHLREFGFVGRGTKMVVNVRVRATAPADPVTFAALSANRHLADVASRSATSRLVYFGPDQGLMTTPVVVRAELGDPRGGPLVVDEPDATIAVPPGWSARLHENTSLVVTKT
jgi:N-methylhydantoinase A